MKKLMKKQCALWLVLAMLLSMILPVCAYAQSVTFSAELNKTSIAKSDSAQEVVVTLKTNSPVTIDGFGVTVTADSPLALKTLAGGEDRIAFTAADYNMSNGKIGWGTADCENISDVTSLAKATITVPANTPAGTYVITFSELELSKDYGEAYVSNASATATLTITEPSAPSEGYTAALSCGVSEVSVGSSISVNVGVSHDSKATFAASEVVLGYDAAKLSFNESASNLNGATVKNANGVLTLENYGANKNCSTSAYVLSFTATADGTASVSLTAAAFSDKESAVKSDLAAATMGNSSVNLTVNKRSFAVTLPDLFAGAATVTEGESYTFTAKDTANYTYAAPTATMGGVAATVTDNGDGTYTIANVTGALVISGSRTAKSYGVTFSGNAASEVTGASTATYGMNYSFTLSAAEGWAYSLSSVTIGGIAYTGYSVSGSTYTIPGAAITGPIVITAVKSQTTASVTVQGSGAGAAAGYNASANIGSPYTLTITPVAGYSYTVTATMGGTETALTKDGNAYTVANVTGNLVFTVEQSVVTGGVSVSKYLTLDGTNLWLVKNEATLASGSVSTYDGAPMFVKGGVYCTLVIADTLDAEQAAAKLGIATGTATIVDSTMDVNMSGKVDANDAQLVYNMYNAEYGAFTVDATVEKFLRADVNADGLVNVSDAAAIIASILG